MDRNDGTDDGIATGGRGDHDLAHHYEITVQGRLSPRWSSWFDGMSVIGRADGTTVVSGRLADQSALHGVLQRIRDLGIPLVAVDSRPLPPTVDTDTQPERT